MFLLLLGLFGLKRLGLDGNGQMAQERTVGERFTFEPGNGVA